MCELTQLFELSGLELRRGHSPGAATAQGTRGERGCRVDQVLTELTSRRRYVEGW